jgi:hypothetical protein
MARLTDDMLDFLASGVAHQVGGCTADGRPLICRALAAEALTDGRLRVLISGVQGFELLEAIRINGRVALCLVAPGDYRAMHLKGRDAQVSAADGPRERALVAERLRRFAAQLAPFGFPPGYAQALYTVPEGALAAITFTPEGAWSQTPGPGAGHALALKP